MVHFKALQILPLGDVTMIGAVRVSTNITSALLVFFPPFRSLLLKIISNFQITNSIMVLSKSLPGCLYKSLLVCLPQRTVWCFWSLQYYFGGKSSLLINFIINKWRKKLWKLGNCKRVDFTSVLKFIWQMKYAWNLITSAAAWSIIPLCPPDKWDCSCCSTPGHLWRRLPVHRPGEFESKHWEKKSGIPWTCKVWLKCKALL